ncbi:MAG: tripartite tricarboxylate transporter substrate binding protein [Pseudomonadota bacterium]
MPSIRHTQAFSALNRRTTLGVIAAVGFGLFGASAALAQDATSMAGKRIRLVVPFSPGGGVDGLARALGEGLQKVSGAAVVVDNKPGAGGNIAANFVAKTTGEPLNLLVTSVNHYANPILVKNSGYDPYKDFVPVGYLSTFPYAFVVPADSKFNTMAELVAKAKAEPGSVSWAFGGNGTLGHFLGIGLEQTEKFKGTPVSYRGGPDLLTALAGKQVDMAIMTVQSSTPLIRQGRLKALAVAGNVRNKALPAVPSISEISPQYPNITGFVVLMAPSSTPEAVLAQLHKDVNKVLVSEEYLKRLDGDGSTANVFPTVTAIKTFFEKDGPQWEALTRSAGLKVE